MPTEARTEEANERMAAQKSLIAFTLPQIEKF
jgi:hypothetical protein